MIINGEIKSVLIRTTIKTLKESILTKFFNINRKIHPKNDFLIVSEYETQILSNFKINYPHAFRFLRTFQYRNY